MLTNIKNFSHFSNQNVGVLLVNLGTPENLNKKSVKNYLKRLLSDRRVVEVPRIIWFIILNFIILPFRTGKAKKKYEKIWLGINGSPLLYFSKKICDKLQLKLKNKIIELAMLCSSPELKKSLENLKDKNCNYIFILPMFPQYASATVGSTFESVTKILRNWRWIPEIRFCNNYHDHPFYIKALSDSILDFNKNKKNINTNKNIETSKIDNNEKSKGDNIEMSKGDIMIENNALPHNNINSNIQKQFLIFSFHGLPYKSLIKGDPYYCQCQKTARLVAESLNLSKEEYIVTFQSRFGRERWLEPYTEDVLLKLVKDNIKNVQIVSPSFAVDCLETLEEINMYYKNIFINAGGEVYEYIPCLNDSESQIELYEKLIEEYTVNFGPI